MCYLLKSVKGYRRGRKVALFHNYRKYYHKSYCTSIPSVQDFPMHCPIAIACSRIVSMILTVGMLVPQIWVLAQPHTSRYCGQHLFEFLVMSIIFTFCMIGRYFLRLLAVSSYPDGQKKSFSHWIVNSHLAIGLHCVHLAISNTTSIGSQMICFAKLNTIPF